MSCCNHGLNDVFTDDVSRKDADSYRRSGLPARAKKLLKAIGALENRTTLEVGLGAGAVTVEMLRRGAARATGVDAVANQLAAARSLATEFGVGDRAGFVLGDFAASDDVPSADVVVLDRVVCCYEDWRLLLDTAARHAHAKVALTYPRDTWWMRGVARLMNVWWRLKRSDFRFRVHPVAEMHAHLRAAGLQPTVADHHVGWEVLIAARA